MENGHNLGNQLAVTPQAGRLKPSAGHAVLIQRSDGPSGLR
jgi:hypothetical protein